MTAKQDLIAAALTLADTHPGDIGGIYHAQKDLREMCARVMVQPVSEVPMPAYDGYDMIDRFIRNNLDDDDYAEYLSGLHEYGDAREAAGYAAGVAEAKAAAAADGMPCEIIEADFEYNTVTLKMNHYGYIVAAGPHYLVPAVAAPQPVSEVPMPEAIGRLHFGGVSCGELEEWEFDAYQGVCDRINESAITESLQDVYLHRDVRTYGEQCRAAGYAAGLAACDVPEADFGNMLDCRTCAHFTADGCNSTVMCMEADQYKATVPRRYWVTMSGEVKP